MGASEYACFGGALSCVMFLALCMTGGEGEGDRWGYRILFMLLSSLPPASLRFGFLVPFLSFPLSRASQAVAAVSFGAVASDLDARLFPLVVTCGFLLLP